MSYFKNKTSRFRAAQQTIKQQRSHLVLILTEVGKYLFPGFVLYQFRKFFGNQPQKFRIDVSTDLPFDCVKKIVFI